MGLFDKLFGKKTDTIDHMVAMADAAMAGGDYARAVETYHSILKLQPDITAQYNLGSLYAQGKGIKQDFMEGAYWFRKAEQGGDEQAGKLCQKCLMDFTYQNLEARTPSQLYSETICFEKYVYPEKDAELEACRNLYALAGNKFNKKEYPAAAKLFRAAAEFGNDGYSQNYLGVLHNAGAGVEKNDLAALYWWDKAVDNGAADVALKDRDGILNAYRNNFTVQEFYKEMMELSGWCSVGSDAVPKDAEKAEHWREIAENWVKGSGNK